MHKRLGIDLYQLGWPQIRTVLGGLTPQEKVDIGFYPKFFRYLWNWVTWLLIWLIGRRRRVRKTAVGLIKFAKPDGTEGISAFGFSKHDQIVALKFKLDAQVPACEKFVNLIKQEIYDTAAHQVKAEYNFLKFSDA
jgi:hypothetical protein